MPTELTPRFRTKCARKGCRKTKLRTQNQIDKHRFDHCSQKCYHLDKQPPTYTAETLRYVKRYLLEYGYAKCAEHIGVSEGALKRQISKWRKEGEAVPYTCIVAVGTVREWKDRDVMIQVIKTESGWRKVPLPPKPKPAKIAKVRQVKVKVVPTRKPTSRAIKAIPKPVNVLPTIVRDESLYRFERVDSRTYRQVLITNSDLVLFEGDNVTNLCLEERLYD